MTDLDQLKTTIADTWRDEEMVSSACYGIEAYSKLWPIVLAVNDWPVWNESGRDLRQEVIAWLDQQGVSWDFYHLLDAWGLVGFDNLKAAQHFKLRWSGVLKAAPSSSQAWNPQPLNSSFIPSIAEEALKRGRKGRQAFR